MVADLIKASEPGAELIARGEFNAYFRRLIASAEAQQLGTDITSDTEFSNEPLKEDEGAKLTEVITALIETNNHLTAEKGSAMDPLRTASPIPDSKPQTSRVKEQ